MLRVGVFLVLTLAACRSTGGPSPGRPAEPAKAEPPGAAGRSRVETCEEAVEEYLRAYGYQEEEFEAVPDRWRIGMPRWDRAGSQVSNTDVPYARGSRANPYRQNVLKGDYPVFGQNTFLVLTALSDTVAEARDVPTPSAISTAGPNRADFFGSGRQQFLTSTLFLTVELFHGNTAFKPPNWVLRVTTGVNGSYLTVDENNAVNFDVRDATDRWDGHVGLQEAFFEKHLVDLSANYDFLSVTVGIQQFLSDFRGFLFFDNNLGVRATANFDDNRTQVNLAAFYMLEKDTNSELNTFDERDQVVVILNAFRQDFLVLGYTLAASVHYNRDNASTHFDTNRVPVRPAVIGDADPHRLDIVYFGFAGDGHFGRLNVTHEYFLAVGQDSDNPVAGRAVDVFAHLAFVELSMDFDWYRPRLSLLWTSGDDDPTDGTARGFDGILDNPNFAGGANSYWIRQGLRILGVGLNQRLSAYPSLRSSKLEGQANFVNPGLWMATAGVDAEVTAELRASLNVSYLRFAETGVLEPFLNQNDVDGEIGWEFVLSGQWRPKLTNNIQIAGGLSVLLPGAGFADLYESRDLVYSAFLQITLVY
jgi:hypothetical protein